MADAPAYRLAIEGETSRFGHHGEAPGDLDLQGEPAIEPEVPGLIGVHRSRGEGDWKRSVEVRDRERRQHIEINLGHVAYAGGEPHADPPL